jgi:hypothetical protein
MPKGSQSRSSGSKSGGGSKPSNTSRSVSSGSRNNPTGGKMNAPARTAASTGMTRGQTAGNKSYYGPKGGNALNTNARMAAARSVGFNAPPVQRTPGDAVKLGRMMMAESGSIRNRFGAPNTTGLQGVADVVRNLMASSRFPNTVGEVLTQRKQFSPIADGSFARTRANPMATRIAESVLSGESPSVVGNALNYGNLHTINNLAGYSSRATRNAFNSMPQIRTIADARNPLSRAHTFGTIGAPSDVAFNGFTPSVPSVQPASFQTASAPRPGTSAIPAPSSTGSLWSGLASKVGIDTDGVLDRAKAVGTQLSDGMQTVARYQSNPLGRIMLSMAGAGGNSPSQPFIRFAGNERSSSDGNQFYSANAVQTVPPVQSPSQGLAAPQPPQPRTHAWTFPQYYSSWAFRPPTPSPRMGAMV